MWLFILTMGKGVNIGVEDKGEGSPGEGLGGRGTPRSSGAAEVGYLKGTQASTGTAGDDSEEPRPSLRLCQPTAGASLNHHS